MKKIPAWLLLCIISLVAGLALGFTNALTKEEIARQDEASNELARKTVMSEADEFVQLDVAADSGVDYCYEAKKGGETIGYVAKATADGYGGKIEVTVGIDNNGMITGISCGARKPHQGRRSGRFRNGRVQKLPRRVQGRERRLRLRCGNG